MEVTPQASFIGFNFSSYLELKKKKITTQNSKIKEMNRNWANTNRFNLLANESFQKNN